MDANTILEVGDGTGAQTDLGPFRVRLAPHALDRLRSAALASLPEEACGLLLGRRSADSLEVAEVVPVPNRALDPQHRYVIDALDHVHVLARAEREGTQWLGFFHAHVDGDARLSATDRAESWTGCVHVVVASRTGEVRAHWLAADRSARELSLVVERAS